MTQHADWIEFLRTQGTINEKGIIDATEHTILCDLSAGGLIAASGEEAEAFLQNQFCNDVKQVNADHSQLNGYCTAKGRLLAFFRLCKHGDQYLLDLPRERLAPVLQRLKMFVLMSKVELRDASDEFIRIGLAGPEAERLLKGHFDRLPESVNDVVCEQETRLVRLPGTVPRFLVMGSIKPLQDLWQSLATQTTPTGGKTWQHLDILAGIPQVVDATAEAFVPQMLNLQSIDALSFKKGCYPGQEVVARMHYLGKQKRRMYLTHAESDQSVESLTPGTAVYAKGENNHQSIGTIVSSTPAPSGGADVLAVLQIAGAEKGELYPEGRENLRLILKDLPYSVEVEGDGK